MIQFNYVFKFVGTMTDYHAWSVQSIGIQCNLLAVPPLRKFKVQDQEYSDQYTSKPEDTDLTDLDASFQLSQEEFIHTNEISIYTMQ